MFESAEVDEPEIEEVVVPPVPVGHNGVLLSSPSVKEASARHAFEDEPVFFASVKDPPLQEWVMVGVSVGHQGVLAVLGSAVEEAFG